MKFVKKDLSGFILLVLVFVFMAVPGVSASDSEALSEAKKALELTGFIETVAGTIPGSVDQVIKVIRQARPYLTEEELTQYKNVLQEEMTEKLGALSEKVAALYAKYYTLSELKETNRFYSTPMGKKIRQSTIDTAPELTETIQNWHMKIAEAAIMRIRQN